MPGIIDIGSNSVRLLFGGEKTTIITRLAENLQRTGRLSEEAMSRTQNVVCGFITRVKSAGEAVHAFGTEPLRAAANADEFIESICRASGVKVEVLSGAEEAGLAYLGACGGGAGTVIDIGGASAEIISGKGGKILYEKSLPLGAVRLTESSLPLQEVYGKMSEYGCVPLSGKIYGVGGSFTSLAAMSLGLTEYDSRIVHGALLKLGEVQNIMNRLISMKGDIELITTAYPVLQPRRAEIITAGAALALGLMKYLKTEYITVSENDNLEGYIIKHLQS